MRKPHPDRPGLSTRELGRAAELRAERFLQAEGYDTLTRNFTAKTGEIDLIMHSTDTLIFVEVRARNHSGYGTGADTVDIRKQRKIIQTAQLFLQRQQHLPWESYRFDVISIGKDIDWIPGAFTLDG